ncbi:hypothetical protein DJ564_13595 [Pseudomonas sp. 31-12]|nr:hypothetical protein DJ564_13595 [Pseudomonas sp. 31-12]
MPPSQCRGLVLLQCLLQNDEEILRLRGRGRDHIVLFQMPLYVFGNARGLARRMADGGFDQLTFDITDAAGAAGLIVDLVVPVILRFRVSGQFQLLPGIQWLMVLGCQM